jgi:hypothetical protein
MNYPRPPASLIEAAARKLPYAIHRGLAVPPGWWSPGFLPDSDGQYDLSETEIIDLLIEAGEIEACAVWAIDWLVKRGFLKPPDAGSSVPDYKTTPDLWEWWSSGDDAETGEEQQERHPVQVDVEKREIRLNGETFTNQPERTCRLLRAWLSKPGEWFGPKDLEAFDSELAGETRLKRVKFPEEVKAWIEAESGKGTRIRRTLPADDQ